MRSSALWIALALPMTVVGGGWVWTTANENAVLAHAEERLAAGWVARYEYGIPRLVPPRAPPVADAVPSDLVFLTTLVALRPGDQGAPTLSHEWDWLLDRVVNGDARILNISLRVVVFAGRLAQRREPQDVGRILRLALLCDQPFARLELERSAYGLLRDLYTSAALDRRTAEESFEIVHAPEFLPSRSQALHDLRDSVVARTLLRGQERTRLRFRSLKRKWRRNRRAARLLEKIEQILPHCEEPDALQRFGDPGSPYPISGVPAVLHTLALLESNIHRARRLLLIALGHDAPLAIDAWTGERMTQHEWESWLWCGLR